MKLIGGVQPNEWPDTHCAKTACIGGCDVANDECWMMNPWHYKAKQTKCKNHSTHLTFCANLLWLLIFFFCFFFSFFVVCFCFAVFPFAFLPCSVFFAFSSSFFFSSPLFPSLFLLSVFTCHIVFSWHLCQLSANNSPATKLHLVVSDLNKNCPHL